MKLIHKDGNDANASWADVILVLLIMFVVFKVCVMKVDIYADGASKGNPGRGGWGCLLLCPEKICAKKFVDMAVIM